MHKLMYAHLSGCHAAAVVRRQGRQQQRRAWKVREGLAQRPPCKRQRGPVGGLAPGGNHLRTLLEVRTLFNDFQQAGLVLQVFCYIQCIKDGNAET